VSEAEASWKCPCGTTVRLDLLGEDPDLVVELDGVVHDHDEQDEED